MAIFPIRLDTLITKSYSNNLQKILRVEHMIAAVFIKSLKFFAIFAQNDFFLNGSSCGAKDS